MAKQRPGPRAAPQSQKPPEHPPVDQTGQPVPEPEHVEVAAVETSALAVMEESEILMQVKTAKMYPRSLAVFKQEASEMIMQDEATAKSCIYRRPVGKERDGTEKIVQGKSIRMAEIVAACYGNLRAKTIITEMKPRYVKAVGVALDLQKNIAFSAECVESTVRSDGTPMTERMRIVIAKAAQSKALRDAIFKIVPVGICKPLEDLAKRVIMGDGNVQTMDKRKAELQAWLKTINVSNERMFIVVDVKGFADMGIDELLIVAGLRTAIECGDITIDEAFPPIESEKKGDKKSGVAGLKDELKNKKTEPPKGQSAKTVPAPAAAPGAVEKIATWCPFHKKRIDINDKHAATVNKSGKLECGECGYELVPEP
jgi:hypothetical protein